MTDIPECVPAQSEEALVDKAVNEILVDLARSPESKFHHAQIDTCNCATGGYPMSVIRKVGHMFAAKGYWVYLVTGGAYREPSWMDVQNYEGREGYTSSKFPSFYERIH